MKIKTALITTVFLFNACNFNKNTTVSGDAYLVFKLSNSSFNIKKIPDNTDYLEITITGIGLENNKAIKKTVKKSEADEKGEIKLKIKDLPIGNKEVLVEAFDTNKKSLALGKGAVLIIGGKVNTITIELKENTLPIVKKSPENMPSPSLTAIPKASSIPVVAKENNILTVKFTNIPADNTIIIAQLKDSNGRLFKGQFLNSNINFKDIPTGITNLKAIILSSSFLPLGKFEKEFTLEKNNKNLEFEAQKATLKEVFEFDETDVNFKNKIASSIKSIFSGYVLPDQGDTKTLSIKESDIEIFIDNKSYSTGNEFIITNTSSIKVNIKQNDPNLRYIWAVTRYLPLRKIYQTNIRLEKGNSLELKLVTNLNSIHVFATDLKTMSNVIAIPIEQFTKSL